MKKEKFIFSISKNHPFYWVIFVWSQLRDSNPGPLLYESIALPTELSWPIDFHFSFEERAAYDEPRSTPLSGVERVGGIEPPSSAWEALIIATIRYPQRSL